MNQVTHIFAKDTRRHWPEITVVLAITALFAWLYPHTWMPQQNGAAMVMLSGQGLAGLAALVKVLMPVSWWILITRVVQGEDLVGDKQWWVTKPYEWGQLLGAKVLFVAAFVVLPLLLAQWVLLARAGFGAFGQLPGQGYDLLLIAVMLLAPVAALAEVTSSFARLVLTGFGVVLVAIAAAVVLGLTMGDRLSVGLPDAVPVLVIVGMAAAMVYAYARRRVGVTRLWLAGIGVVGVGLMWLSYSEALIVNRYPAAENIALGLNVDENKATASPAQTIEREKRVEVLLPVTATGLGANEAATVDAVQVTAKAADGRQWASPWETEYGLRLRADDAERTIGVRMDEGFLQQVKTEPLELDLRLAVTELRTAGTMRMAMAGQDFAVPGFGVCAPATDFRTSSSTPITCRAALQEPALTYVTVEWSDTPCGSGAAAGGVLGAAWVGSEARGPGELNLAGVWSSSLELSNSFDPDKVRKPGENPQRYLCPGSPMTFTRYELVRRGQSTVTVTNFRVPDWKMRGIGEPVPGSTATGAGVTVGVSP